MAEMWRLPVILTRPGVRFRFFGHYDSLSSLYHALGGGEGVLLNDYQATSASSINLAGIGGVRTATYSSLSTSLSSSNLRLKR